MKIVELYQSQIQPHQTTYMDIITKALANVLPTT